MSSRSEKTRGFSGLTLALRAYDSRWLARPPRPSMDSRANSDLPGLGADVADEGAADYLREWVLTFPYAPNQDRANGAVRNLSAFHEAFGVTANDRRIFVGDGARDDLVSACGPSEARSRRARASGVGPREQ